MSVFLGQQQQQTHSPPEWKTSIYSSLVHRNHTENSHFYSIVNEYRLLLQENATQKSSLLKLKSENRTLLNKNVQLSDQIMLNNNNNNNNNSSSLSDNLIFHQKVKQLEEKIVQLQEELTSSLKGKAESIQQQLNLNNEIKELNKQLSMRKDESEDVKKQLTESQKKMVELERSIESKNGAIEVLKGDIVALREDLSARDDQMNKLKEENRQMIDRAISEKQKQVDAMNQVNELHRTVMIQKQQLALLQAKYQTQNSSGGGGGGGHDNIASSSSGSSGSNNNTNNNNNNMMTMDESEETLLFANHLMNQSSGSSSSGGGGGRGSMGGRSHSNASSDSVSLTPPKQVLYRKMTDSQINAVVFSSDSMMIATAHNDKTVKLWNSRTGTITTTLHGSADAVVAVSMCPNQRLVAGSSTDNICRIWSMATARVQYSLTGHTKKIYATDFTNDGKRLITGSHDRTIKIWELQYGNCEKTLLTCKSSVNDLECNPGTPIFISGHFDACARLWDLRSPYTLVHEYNTIHKQQITSVNFSRDGNTLLTNARDNLLQVIDVRTHKILHTLSHDDYKNNVNQNKAVMSPCGSYAIAGTSSTKNVCYVWDISPRSLAMRIAASSSSSSFGKSTPIVVPKAVALDGGHKQAITGCAWSPDGAQIASVSIDKQLVVYQ